MPILTFQISILNHFLSFLTCPLWPEAMTFGSSEAKRRTVAAVWSVLVNSIQFPWVFHLIAVILRSDRVPLKVRNVLMSWTVVALSLLESGGGVESKTMAKHIGWWALLGLVGTLGQRLVIMGRLVFWLVAASA